MDLLYAVLQCRREYIFRFYANFKERFAFEWVPKIRTTEKRQFIGGGGDSLLYTLKETFFFKNHLYKKKI